MQFSVVVHTANENGATDRVKQVLETVRITPDLIHKLGPGQPLLIKRRFSEGQASKLRDQLVGLGLESSILPLTNRQRTATGEHAVRPPSSDAKAQHINKLSPRTLKEVSEQIQSLFVLPPDGVPDRPPQKTAAFCTWALYVRILAGPLLDGLLLIACCGLLVAGGGWLTAHAFSYSLLLGIVLLPFFLASILNSLALIAFVVWPRQPRPFARLPLNSREDPRLMLFTRAVCRLVKAPQPVAICLTMDSEIHASLKQENDAEARITLELSVPLLQALTLAELASLLARACGRHSETAAHGPLQLIEKGRDLLRRYMECQLDLTPLSQAGLNLKSQGMVEILHRAAKVLQAGEIWRVRRVRSHLARADKLLQSSGRSRQPSRLFWGGPTQSLDDKVQQMRKAFEEKSQQLDNPADSLLVDQWAASIAADFQSPASPPTDRGWVRSQLPARALIKSLDQSDRALSRLFYQSRGLELKSFSLLNPDEVQQRRQRDKHYRQIAEHYFSDWLKPRQFWQIPGTVGRKSEALPRLNRCIAQLRHLAPERNGLIAKQQRLQQQLAELRAAKKVTATGKTYKFIHCSDIDSRSDIPVSEARLQERNKECGEELFHQNSVMGERLLLGLALAQQQGVKTASIINALSSLAKMRSKLEQLQMELNELALLNDHSRGMVASQFTTYQRELLRSIEHSYQHLVRQLQKCPYAFCDPGTATLGELLQRRIQQHMPRLSTEKAQLLLTIVDDAQEKISYQAAGIAARMEQHYKIDKIKRLDGFARSPANDFVKSNSA